MRLSAKDMTPNTANLHLLLAYVADLELEVDRLRKHGQVIQHEVRSTLRKMQQLGEGADAEMAQPALADIGKEVKRLAGLLRDLQEPSGYHPAHDQVIAIAVRPLIEQVFRWQQCLVGTANVELRLELESDYVEWFPARLRHILDNLISNSLKYSDPDKEAAWLQIGLRALPEGYEIRVSDNGVGLPPGDQQQMLELFYRSAPVRAAGLGVGLAVVKLLVEKSGGTLTVNTGEGQGTTFVVVLPRYDVDDYLV